MQLVDTLQLSTAIICNGSKTFATRIGSFEEIDEFKLYWMERMQKRTWLDVDIECTEYVHDAAKRATRALSSFSTAANTTIFISTASTPSTPCHTTTIFYNKRYHENNLGRMHSRYWCRISTIISNWITLCSLKN
ncbi:unnamed protein product [Rhizopus stolonifer]